MLLPPSRTTRFRRCLKVSRTEGDNSGPRIRSGLVLLAEGSVVLAFCAMLRVRGVGCGKGVLEIVENTSLDLCNILRSGGQVTNASRVNAVPFSI
jgi:hypothetical protein